MNKHKVVMLGMWGVGKTSLVQRFVNSIYDERYHTTLGVKVDKKVVEIDGAQTTLLLWDIAGAEDQFLVPSHYLHGASGYLIVIDGTRKASLECALQLINRVEQDMGKLPYIPIINKCDLNWEITIEDVARSLGTEQQIFVSSAKTDEQVAEAFLALARAI
ncbi:Rab family GTPase [Acaryochloris sp. IP29b_bin.137]|uniref:Rab family GTPase n=1 Tax=Acaryochloris sp. IP29b_bin.137 TaxID=2969217 RepID=UPI00261C59F0|nr:Rab family GTPase [Acaryochloris sp. IP29b_bin.137]